MVESGKSGGMRLNQSFTKQFDASFFKEMDSEQKKKLAVYSGFAFVGIASLFGIMYGGEDYSLPEVAQVYRPQSPVQPTRSVDVEGLVKAQIQKAIGEDLKGANKNLFFEKRERFRRAPDFVFGYKKEQMTCAINVSRCEVLYSADGAYREFNSGITSLRPLFDNVVFAVQGDTLTGIWDITQDMLYSVPTNLDDLPRNDGGESVVGNVLRLRTTRPNLSVSVSGAQLVNVSFDEIKDLDRRDLNYEFIRLGWSASGMSHQANLVVDTISRPSMAINSWRILKTDGLEQFTMNGVFLMRKN